MGCFYCPLDWKRFLNKLETSSPAEPPRLKALHTGITALMEVLKWNYLAKSNVLPPLTH